MNNSEIFSILGIPVFDESPQELSSPIMIRKLQNGDRHLSTSPIGSPYENVYYNRNNLLKPKSPNTQSPRSRIKTTYAHKNQPSPQYFIFPTPPASDSNKIPNFDVNQKSQNFNKKNLNSSSQNQNLSLQNQNLSFQNQNLSLQKQNLSSQNQTVTTQHQSKTNRDKDQSPKEPKRPEKVGIEKQLSLEEEIPMIDDVDISNDIELRHSKPDEQKQSRTEQKQTLANKQEENEQPCPSNITQNEKRQHDIPQQGKRQSNDHSNKRNSLKDDITETKVFIEREIEIPEKLQKNKSFEDVKKELMADIPELEEFEKDLQDNKREKIIKHITEDIRKLDFKADSIDSMLDDNVGELKTKYEKLKEERKKMVTEIHEIKNKMTEIRSQEDDILREVSSFL